MKVWLDDVRDPPGEDWVHLRTPEEVIELLRAGRVTDLSLDHDLGLVTAEDKEWTGYDVPTWIEHELANGSATFQVPRIAIHSANVVGRRRMEQALDSIRRLSADQERPE